MKKRSILTALLCSVCLTVGGAVPAMADASRVVTLGADLTQDQKNTMMQYFKANASEVQILTVTNADEREYLGNYIPLEQIGTRTLSCAYVKPTQSGGIKVRTANLNYVTGKMIANALSTAGISNCEAVAACPYEVSGTGALTGVMMAYETAVGQKLDTEKKDLATKEVVVTGNLAQQVGEDNATNIINQAKLQIIGENVQNADEIYNIVNNIAVENNVNFSEEEMNAIVSLLQQIAQQSYDIEQMKNTLEEIQESMDKEDEVQATETPAPEEGEGTESGADTEDVENTEDTEDTEGDGEDITETVDPSVLGDDVKQSSTEDPSLAEKTMGDTPIEEGGETSENETGIPEGETYVEGGETPEASAEGTESIPEGDVYEEGAETPEAPAEGTESIPEGDVYEEGAETPEAPAEGTESIPEGDVYEEGAETPEASTEGTESIPEGDVYEEGAETPEASTEGTESIPEGDVYEEGAGTEIPEASADEGIVMETPEAADDGTVVDPSVPEETVPEASTETGADNSVSLDSLSEEARTRYETTQNFCKGEYEGDAAALQTATGDPAAAASVTLDTTADPAVGTSLSQKVLDAYLTVLNDGGMSYVPDGTETYMSAELNMVNSEMKKIFSIDAEPAADDLLAAQTPEVRQGLYDDTMKFFAELYGEGTSADAAEAAPAEEAYTEEVYTEEGTGEQVVY